jgi:hypothetical protein
MEKRSEGRLDRLFHHYEVYDMAEAIVDFSDYDTSDRARRTKAFK